MRNLIKKFQNISHQYNLWQRGSKIILAVSGGPDSVCMLDIFAKLQKKYNLELIIAHVNYGLRGRDSDKDEEFARKLAEKHEMKLEVLKNPISGSRRFNLRRSENELRKIRYEFFEKVRKENKFDLIAVAHNLDDQAETLLMRLIRGSGLAGMAAMKHKRDKVIRPLLGIARHEILEYLKTRELKYRIDKTNNQRIFFRNKIRNKLIPYIEKEYNPQIKETLYNSSLSVAEDHDLINALAEKYYKKNKELRISKIIKLHPSLQRRIILKAIKNVKSDLKDIESTHIKEVLKILKSTKNKSQIVLLKGLKIVRKNDRIIISHL